MIFVKLYFLLFGIYYSYKTIEVLKHSNMPCLGLFHRWKLTYDSQDFRGLLAPAAACGWKQYTCGKCEKKKTEHWSVF